MGPVHLGRGQLSIVDQDGVEMPLVHDTEKSVFDIPSWKKEITFTWKTHDQLTFDFWMHCAFETRKERRITSKKRRIRNKTRQRSDAYFRKWKRERKKQKKSRRKSCL